MLVKEDWEQSPPMYEVQSLPIYYFTKQSLSPANKSRDKLSCAPPTQVEANFFFKES
jgi:hypothetical protein